MSLHPHDRYKRLDLNKSEENEEKGQQRHVRGVSCSWAGVIAPDSVETIRYQLETCKEERG